MRDEDKSREQLIAELQEARARSAVPAGGSRSSASVAPGLDYRHLIANFPNAVAVLDPHFVYQEVSPTVTSLYGVTRQDMVGRTMYDLFPESWAQIRPILDKVRDTGETHSFTAFRFTVTQGESVRETYWDTSWSPVTENGRFMGYLGIGQEVTERVRLEQEAEKYLREIKRQRDLNAQIIDNAPAGIGFMDRDLIFRWVNPTLARFLRVKVDDMLNRSVIDIFPEVKDQYVPIMDQVLSTGKPFQATEMPFYYKVEGEDITTYWDFTYMPVPGDDGQPVGILVLNQEVSERVSRERLLNDQVARLQELDRLKTNFINAVSHELRTPLASIMGYAEFIEDGLGGPVSETQREYLDHIQAGVRRLRLLVDDLLDYARLEAGSMSLLRSPADLETLTRDAVASLQPIAKEAGVEIRVAVAPGGRRLSIDARRIEQVVLNLLSNAVKFTPRSGWVEVRLTWTPDGARVEVADSGIGISSDHVDHVFDRFFQADSGMTRTRGGAGLGLAISKAIVEAHGGAIGVDSEPDKGSTFWFSVPG